MFILELFSENISNINTYILTAVQKFVVSKTFFIQQVCTID